MILFTYKTLGGKIQAIYHRNLTYQKEISNGFYKEVLENKQINSLTGLRRIGKTTLMKQVIANLLKKGANPKTIIYFLLTSQLFKKTLIHWKQLLIFLPKKLSFKILIG
ncbi:hypothetical protein CO166_03485 [Candidatus Roizmanbacteria bacterium CG_4_9_14_3_um_filter_36_11]|nr:MAG: hypothetical protein CO166_03485 [Candidatus Roizmanbacteria bacterium CG_4_9_14_3_um_filter_36_11]